MPRSLASAAEFAVATHVWFSFHIISGYQVIVFFYSNHLLSCFNGPLYTNIYMIPFWYLIANFLLLSNSMSSDDLCKPYEAV